MAAAGGGLAALVGFAGASLNAPARGRFPGRPWSCRSRHRTCRRSRVGRLGQEEAAAAATATGGPKEPRPVTVELTLLEDPSLLRVLRLNERLARQKEAGFCTSGSDEVSSGNCESLKRFSFFKFVFGCVFFAPVLWCPG